MIIHKKNRAILLLAILFIIAACIASLPILTFANNNEDEIIAVNKNTSAQYTNIPDALKEAAEGNTIDVVKGNPKGKQDARFRIGVDHGIPNNVTLQKSSGLTDEVCLDCDYELTVAYFYNGATFNNLSFNFGNHIYHGIDGAGGTLTFNNCKLYGLQHGYVTSYFNDCIFDNTEHPVGEYNMWTYSAEVHYTNCEFKSKGKFINVYNSGIGVNRDIEFDGCKFINVSGANKSAVNVKATTTEGTTVKELHFHVKITDCTLEGLFPTNNRLGNKFAMIDDGNSRFINISLNNNLIYPEPPEVITDVSDIGQSKTITTSLADPSFPSTRIKWTSSNENVISLSQVNNSSNEVTGNSVKVTRIGFGFSRVTATDGLTGLNSIFYFGNPSLFFDMQGHGQQIDSQSFDPQDETDLPKKPEDPTCEGFEFEGWYTNPEFTTEFNFAQLVTDDTTIYAKWKENEPGPGPEPGPSPDPQNPEFINQVIAQTWDTGIAWPMLLIAITAISLLLVRSYLDKSKISKGKHVKIN